MPNKFLVIGIFITITSVLITVNVIFHETLSRELADSYNRQQAYIAQGIANSIKTDIDKQIVKIQLIAALLSHYSAKEIERLDALFTDQFKREFEEGFKVSVFDRYGSPVVSTGTGPAGNLPDRRDPRRQQQESSVYYDQEHIHVLSPISHGDQILGWVLINLPIREIARKHMVPFTNRDQGYAWLMDHRGTLLCHPHSRDLPPGNLNVLPEERETRGECSTCHRSFGLSRQVLAAEAGAGGRFADPEGEDKILAFARFNIGDNEWLVVVASPYAEVVAGARDSMKTYSWLVVAIFASFFFGATILAWLIRKNIQTERAANEAILVESKKLDTIVATIGAGLVFLDKNHEVVWANETVEKWGGELTGQSWGNVCPVCPLRQEEPGRVYHDICKGLFGRKGNTYQVTSAPINNTQGEFLGVLKLLQDITEIKTIEEKIAQTEKLSALGRIAAGIAHEIGNPLTSISSFVQILKERAGDDFARQNFDRIEHNIQRITRILNQMSRFSKVPSMDIREHNLNDTINSCIEIVKFDKKLKQCDLRLELADDLPPARFDDGNMVQVFTNLILNAADALGEAGGAITIRTFSGQNQVIAQVCDNGPGIPEEMLGQIFDPFFTTKEKGTGLGLSISHEIVQKFGGDLLVESRPDQGAVFSIILPTKHQGENHG